MLVINDWQSYFWRLIVFSIWGNTKPELFRHTTVCVHSFCLLDARAHNFHTITLCLCILFHFPIWLLTPGIWSSFFGLLWVYLLSFQPSTVLWNIPSEVLILLWIFQFCGFSLSHYDICCHFYVVCKLLKWCYLFFISLRCPHWGCQSLWLFCLLLSLLVHRHDIFSLDVLAGARCYVWKSLSWRIWGLGWHSSPLKRATKLLGCPYSKLIFNCGEDWDWGVK